MHPLQKAQADTLPGSAASHNPDWHPTTVKISRHVCSEESEFRLSVRYSYHYYTYFGHSGTKYRYILTSLSSIDLAAACLACFLELPEPVAVISGIITWNKFFILRWKILAFDLLQWGSESRPFKNLKHSKTGLFEGRYSKGGTIWKPDNWFVVQMVGT